MSAFANATGGTLVIGIQTQKISGIDRASGLQLISNVDNVVERYRAYIEECVSPPISSVRIGGVKNDSEDGTILVGIPRGDARPHMSMAPDHQRYYRRVGTSAVPMRHYEIEEMTRLKVSPNLELVLKLITGGSISGNNITKILFGVRNISSVTAKYPYISYLEGPEVPRTAEYGLDGNGRTLWQKLPAGVTPAAVFAAGADMVLHPNQSVFVSMIEMTDHPEQRNRWAISSIPEGGSVVLQFELGCEDIPASKQYVRLTKEHFKKRCQLSNMAYRTRPKATFTPQANKSRCPSP